MPDKYNEVSLCPLIVYTNSGSDDVQRNQFWISAAQSVRHYAPPAAQDSNSQGQLPVKEESGNVMWYSPRLGECWFCPRTSCMMSHSGFIQDAKCVR